MIGRGAGTTNVVWGYVVYDWVVALLVLLIGGLSFTILRERQQGRIGVLLLVPLITALHRQRLSETVAAIALCGLIAWIYQKLPDDLDLSSATSEVGSQKMFKFFQGDRALLSLISLSKSGKWAKKQLPCRSSNAGDTRSQKAGYSQQAMTQSC